MDPLTITTSIVGLLTATAQVAKFLEPYATAAKDTPKIVTQVHSEVVYSRTILLALEGLTTNLAAIPVKRAALIEVDQLVAVFTDGVLLFSELEATLPSLPPAEPTITRMSIMTRLRWASKESAFVALLARIQSFKVSISSMLIILQSDSDTRAEVQQQKLFENVSLLLETNQSLSRRLMNLESAFEKGTIHSKRQSREFISTEEPKQDQLDEPNEDGAWPLPNSLNSTEGSCFDFENDLKISRPYRMAQRDTVDFSFRSSIAHTNAWSQFSGLSLSNISAISAIALPLYLDEIENAQHYVSGEGQTVMLVQPIPDAPRPRPLYQNCLGIEAQLAQIPGFPEILAIQREESEEEDPLTFLIHVLRQGIPLLMLLAKVQGTQNVAHLMDFQGIPEDRKFKIPKIATFRFLKACMVDLDFRPDEIFTMQSIFGSEPTGYIKVIEVVNRLLDMITNQGDMHPIDLEKILPKGDQEMTGASPIATLVEDFLANERSYVANLEGLLVLKTAIELDSRLQSNVLSDILRLLTPIVNIQRCFLLAIEIVARRPLEEQAWATSFRMLSEKSSLYTIFITTVKGATEYIRIVLAERQRIEVEATNPDLIRFLRLLSLPSQRLPQYREFLQGLLACGNEVQKQDVLNSIQALDVVSQDIKTTVRSQELQEAAADLANRVQDWKNHRVENFGKLLLFDVVDIVNPKSNTQKTYRIYLYERILLVLKEESSSRNFLLNLRLRREKSSDPNQASPMKLVGRIFVVNITDIISLSKPGQYTCQIFYSGEHGVESVILRFSNDIKMKRWYEVLDAQKRTHTTNPEPISLNSGAFPWMKDPTAPSQNPYAELDQDDDEIYKINMSPQGSVDTVNLDPLPREFLLSPGIWPTFDPPSQPLLRPSRSSDGMLPSQSPPLVPPPLLKLRSLLKD